MVVDPWGNILIEGGEDPNLLTVDLELDLVEEVRNAILGDGYQALWER